VKILQNSTAIGINLKTAFQAVEGTAPYVYSVLPGGAGGTIDANGMYTAPSSVPSDPKKTVETIQAEDADGTIVTAKISILDPLGLFMDIIRSEMGLDADQIYLWDQKINIPNDSRLYIAVSVLSCKPFSNVRKYVGSTTLKQIQYTNFRAILQVDIFSRGTLALTRKEEVIMAMKSDYAQSQQEVNAFKIGELTTSFNNLSQVEGSAIPYRFNISIPMMYTVSKGKDVKYFNEFRQEEILTN